MESLLFLTEKWDKRIKSQHCANGSTRCPYMECDKVMSLTIGMEGTLLTTVIEAQEGQDVATCDIPNVFVHIYMEEKDKEWKLNHHEDKGNLCGHPPQNRSHL